MNLLKRIVVPAAILVAGMLPASAAVTGHFEKTLQVSGPVDLDVVSGSGNIKIHPGGSGSVQIVATIHTSNSWFGGSDVEERVRKIEQNPPVQQQGNSIRIGHVDDRELMRNISIDYDITAPAQTKVLSQTGSGDQKIDGLQLGIVAKTGSGNVTVENIGSDVRISSGSGELTVNSVKGMLTAEAGSGNVRAKGIAGEVSASTGSGDIDIQQISAGNARLEAGSGNVTLTGLKGGLRAQTGSGDIRIEGQPAESWYLSAGSGNIKLNLPAQSSFDLDARTSSGSLHLNHPVTVQGTISHTHVQGKAGNGGPMITMHTGSGDIDVD